MRTVKIIGIVGAVLVLLGILAIVTLPKSKNFFSDRATADNTKVHFETTVRDIKNFTKPTSFTPEYDFTRTSGAVWDSRAQITASLSSSYDTEPDLVVDEVIHYLRQLEGYASKQNWDITYEFNNEEYSSVEEFTIDSSHIQAIVTNCKNTDRFAFISTIVNISESSYEVDMRFTYTPEDSDKRGIFWCTMES